MLTFSAKFNIDWPRIPHHNAIMIARASIIFESEISIAVLCLLGSPHYTVVRIKNYSKSMSMINVATTRNTIVRRVPQLSYWNWSIHCPSLSAMFDLLHSSTNKEVLEKRLCIKSSHYEKYGRFLHYTKEAITWNHQINAFHCQQRWMEDTDKNTLHAQRCAKRHLSGWSDVE